MTVRGHCTTTALLVGVACALMTGAGAARGAAGERDVHATGGTAHGAAAAGGVGLSIPRPTGRHPVGVRSTFVRDPTRTEPTTGGPRAIPAWVWYPAEHRGGAGSPLLLRARPGHDRAGVRTAGRPVRRRHPRDGRRARAAPGAGRAAVHGRVRHAGRALHRPDHRAGLARIRGRGVRPSARDASSSISPTGRRSSGTPRTHAAAFQARLLDVGAVLDALGALVPRTGRRTPIGILGHSSGGAAAGEAMLLHGALRAGVNLDGFIPGGALLPGGRLLTEGLDRPFGLMLSLDLRPDDLREIETFLSNMRAPHPVRSLAIAPLRLQRLRGLQPAGAASRPGSSGRRSRRSSPPARSRAFEPGDAHCSSNARS